MGKHGKSWDTLEQMENTLEIVGKSWNILQNEDVPSENKRRSSNKNSEHQLNQLTARWIVGKVVIILQEQYDHHMDMSLQQKKSGWRNEDAIQTPQSRSTQVELWTTCFGPRIWHLSVQNVPDAKDLPSGNLT